MIAVEHLNRTYGSLHAVRDVSFNIGQGEVIGLLGPNGAGKTTIMKMMCGFLEPSSGKVTINGADIAQNTKLAQSFIGYLPENLPVYPEMTVMAYLEYAAGLRGIPGQSQGAEIRRVIDATDLRDKALARIGDLSRGLKQRVGVAQALLGSPRVLVLDEPTNGLDPTQALQMRQLIRKLSETATVILSTHILSEVEAVCDRVLMVRSGQLVLDSRLDDIQQSGGIQLETNLAPSQLKTLMTAVAGVASFDVVEADSGHTCRIELAPAADARAVASAVARAVFEAGGELYQLHREQRDLESLFRELNRGEGLAHAA